MKKCLQLKPTGGGGHRSQQVVRFAHNFVGGLKSGSTNQNKNFTLANLRFSAFTLAEVLITLAIIGVVAALTIPTLISNYQKHQYVTALKKNYNILNNGFKQILAKDGVTKMTDTTLWSKFGNSTSISFNSADSANKQAFLAELSKTFSIISTSSPTVSYSALVPFVNMVHSKGIVLKDGTIIYYSFGKNAEYGTDYMIEHNLPRPVGTLYIDVNGEKKPNVIGRDLFLFSLYDDGSVHADGDTLYAKFYCGEDYDSESCIDYWKNGQPEACSTTDESSGFLCAARIMEEGWQMKY